MVDLKHGKVSQAGVIFLYLILLASNFALSYSGFPWGGKGVIFFFGILFPFLVFLQYNQAMGEKELLFKDPAALSRPSWVLFGLGTAALFLRFFNLTSFHSWPTGDEGLHGFLSIPLVQKWDWQFFYTVGEHPPLLIWVLSFFYRCFDSPFFNLWFFPAVFSLLAVPAGYWASRQYFSKTLSSFFGLLMAFSFWPLYFGRFCHQGVFIPLWELLAFLFLGFWAKNRHRKSGAVWAAVLGLWTGSGTLTFPSCVFVIAIIFITVGFIFYRREKSSLFFFLCFFALGITPFALAVFREGYGHHLLDSSGAAGGFLNAQHWVTHLSYVSSLFWGPIEGGGSYGPLWGGMLNPVLSSCFLLGLGEMIKIRKSPAARWILFSFGVCLLPALLAGDYVELNRVIQTLPFLLFLAALGFLKLFKVSKENKIYFFPVLLIFMSLVLDGAHLQKAMACGNDAAFKNKNEQLKIYGALKKEAEIKGPGLIFTDFLTLDQGHVLNALTYSFNAAAKSSPNQEKAKWAGLITNVYYLPFLAARFPGARWIYLKNDYLDLKGKLAAGIIPLDNQNEGIFKHWHAAHDYFHRLNLEAERGFNGREYYLKAVRGLGEGGHLVKGDRFLEASFWEWSSQYYFDPEAKGNILALAEAIKKGYPAAHLYYRLGTLLKNQNQTLEAERMMGFAEAQRAKFIQQWGSFNPE